MSLPSRRVLLRCALPLLAVVLAGAIAQAAEARRFSPTANFTAAWTRADALKVKRDPTNTKPLIPPDFPVMDDSVWVWDTWPLVDLDGRPIKYQGWNIIFSLVAPRTLGFNDRHEVATIGYFYSRDAKSWQYGGTIFPAGTARGTRQWAGSATLIGNEVNLFYTASGVREGFTGHDPDWLFADTEQRVTHATATIDTDADGVTFGGEDFGDSRIVLEADGRYYQTVEQSQGSPIIYAFRDPFLFRDPEDHRIYLAFEGNSAGRAGSHTCGERELGHVPPGHVVPGVGERRRPLKGRRLRKTRMGDEVARSVPQVDPFGDARYYTGNIGLAAMRGDLDSWKLLPPLVSANCTNQQLERPHLVIEDGRYYLFTISHTGTYAPGLTGPDGVYGFAGDGLRSDYQPINASGLVLGNPAEAPFEAYSEYVMPNWLVEAFIDNQTGPGQPIREGGTLAPTLRLAAQPFDVEGANTYLVERLDYGFIPEMVQVP